MYGFKSLMMGLLKSCVRITADSVRRERSLGVIFEAMKEVLRLLPKSDLKVFVVDFCELVSTM